MSDYQIAFTGAGVAVVLALVCLSLFSRWVKGRAVKRQVIVAQRTAEQARTKGDHRLSLFLDDPCEPEYDPPVVPNYMKWAPIRTICARCFKPSDAMLCDQCEAEAEATAKRREDW